MYHTNVDTKMMVFNILNQLKHIPLKALVAQWIHPTRSDEKGVLGIGSILWLYFVVVVIVYMVINHPREDLGVCWKWLCYKKENKELLNSFTRHDSTFRVRCSSLYVLGWWGSESVGFL